MLFGEITTVAPCSSIYARISFCVYACQPPFCYGVNGGHSRCSLFASGPLTSWTLVIYAFNGHYLCSVAADTRRALVFLLRGHGVILPVPVNRERRIDPDSQSCRLALLLTQPQLPCRIASLVLVWTLLPVAVLPLTGIAKLLVETLVPRAGRHGKGGQERPQLFRRRRHLFKIAYVPPTPFCSGLSPTLRPLRSKDC